MIPCKRCPLPCPAPGLYLDMPMEEYLGIAAVSAGLLKSMKVSAMRARQWLDSADQGSTRETVLGTAIHACLLERKRFKADADEIDGLRNGSSADKFHKAVLEHPETIVLADGWLDMLRRVRANAYRNQWFRELLGGDGLNEAVIIWRDGGTGLLCKLRVDRLTRLREHLAMLDFKSMASADHENAGRGSWTYGYHISGAHYEAGILHARDAGWLPSWANDAEPGVMPIIGAIQTSGERDAVPYLCDDQTFMAPGRIEWRACATAFARAFVDGKWPGLAGHDGFPGLSLPAWALARFNEGY